MAIRAEKVTTTIVVKGQDRASKEVRKAGKSVDGLSKQADRAKRKFSDLRSGMQQAFGGDVLGAVQSFKGALGGIGGSGGVAALAAGGVAALGVAAVASAVKLTRALEEVERFRVQARAAFAGGEEEALRFADTIGGVTVRSVVEFRSQLAASGVEANLTAQQLQNLTAIAANVGKTGDDALTALAQAIRTGNTRALNSVGVFINASRVQDEYAKSLGKTTTELTAQEKQAAVVAELQRRLSRNVDAANTVWARQDGQLAKLSNNYERIKLSFSEAFAPAAVSVLETINAQIDELNGNAERARREVDKNREAQIALNRAYLQTVDEGTFEMLRGLKDLGPLFDATRSDAVQFTSALVTMMRRTDDAAKAVADSVDDTIARFQGAFKLMGRATGLTTAFEAATGDKAALETIRDARKRDRARRRKERRARRTGAPQRAARSAAAQTAADIGGGAADDAVGFGDADLAFVMAQAKRAQEEAAALREKEAEARRVATEARLEQERQLAEAQQRAIELERTRRMEAIDTASAITSAALNLGTSTAMLAKNDKLQRALLAGRSLADAAREAALAASAGAAGNAPKAIAHGLAAAAHGVAAARYRSAGKGGGGAGANAARPSAGAVDQVARGADNRGGGNVTINAPPGFLIGTPAQLAAELRRLQLAGAGTGL